MHGSQLASQRAHSGFNKCDTHVHSCSAAAKRESKASSSKAKLKLDPDGKAPAGFGSGAEEDWDDEEAGPQFDHSQYYPGTLPLQLHHPEDDAGQPELQAQLMRQGVPQDLVLRQVRDYSCVQLQLRSRVAMRLVSCSRACVQGNTPSKESDALKWGTPWAASKVQCGSLTAVD
jgi:hypothetical protein